MNEDLNIEMELQPSRQENEEAVRNLANFVTIIDIYPSVNTHLGEIDTIDQNAMCIQTIDNDWCPKGTLSDLTDEEFDKIFSAVQKYTIELNKSFCQR